MSFEETEYSRFFSQYIFDSLIVIPKLLIIIFNDLRSSRIRLILEKLVSRILELGSSPNSFNLLNMFVA